MARFLLSTVQTCYGTHPISCLFDRSTGSCSPPGVKQPRSEADRSSPSSVEVRRYASTPPYVFMAWCFFQRRNNFTNIFVVYLMTLKEINSYGVD
jgi:hypothetical protein